MEIPDSYQSKSISNVNMPVTKSNFEGIFSIYVFGKCFWHFPSRIVIADKATFIMQKKY